MNKLDLFELLFSFSDVIWLRDDNNKAVKQLREIINLLIDYITYNDDISQTAKDLRGVSGLLINYKLSESEKDKIINELKTRISKK